MNSIDRDDSEILSEEEEAQQQIALRDLELHQ